MSTRLVDGEGGRVERWLAGLAGADLEQPGGVHAGHGSPPAGGSDGRCPTCHKPRSAPVGGVERYDEDYDYYWGEWRLPLWIALIWQVPWRQRLDIFVVGLLVGLIIAGVALLWGLLLSQY